MNGEELHDLARGRALGLPGASAEWPFGPKHEVFKVRGKVFLMLTSVPQNSSGFGVDADQRGQPVITLKAEPDDGEALRLQYEEVSVGYHMNKRHWISVTTGPAVDAALIEELVVDSYRLVAETLPRSSRPFGWDDPAILN